MWYKWDSNWRSLAVEPKGPKLGCASGSAEQASARAPRTGSITQVGGKVGVPALLWLCWADSSWACGLNLHSPTPPQAMWRSRKGGQLEAPPNSGTRRAPAKQTQKCLTKLYYERSCLSVPYPVEEGFLRLGSSYESWARASLKKSEDQRQPGPSLQCLRNWPREAPSCTVSTLTRGAELHTVGKSHGDQ